jgi:Lrp/AsnC family transcriptional regulator, leucine-responsive regulatory protein
MTSALDTKTLQLLAQNARITWSELANELGVSPPAAADRVRRLEEKGIIKGYGTLVDHDALGYKLLAFIFVVLAGRDSKEPFLKMVKKLANILECHHVTGEYDYLLKVRCKDTKELDALISERLKGIVGVSRTVTNIVLSSQKEVHSVPSDDDA